MYVCMYMYIYKYIILFISIYLSYIHSFKVLNNVTHAYNVQTHTHTNI